ncbi:MAG: SusF/SusE family outer membrane protein [Cyclobacteriaceae bacterium]
MKNLLYIIILSLVAGLYSCSPEEIDIQSLSDFAPGIKSVNPIDGGTVVQGDFDIRVDFVDGTISPLAEGTITLMDENDNVIVTQTKQLTGTLDSMIMEGSEFDAAGLDLGNYKLVILGKDAKDQLVERTTTFAISDLAFPAINRVMYIAGEFNGWGADELTLISDYTWEIKEVDLQGGEWKLKNTVDWTDQDWGDDNCDGVMEVKGPNIDCNYTGLVNITFNDQTLRYTVKPSVEYETNLNGLVLLGTFNNFQGQDYPFTLTEDYTWTLDEVRLKPGDNLKFAEFPTFQGTNFGDNEGDLKAEEFGSNIVIPDTLADGFYKITFNDRTLNYSIELVRLPFPSEAFLVGGSTPAGWDPSASLPFESTGEGFFEIFTPLTVAGDGFKYLQMQDWAGDWGSEPGSRNVSNGQVTGNLLQEGEDNVTVENDGFYRINLNFVDKNYAVTPSNWSIIGDATPNGWDADTDMTFASGFTWTLTVNLVAGEMKFRENKGWDVNFGDDGADGNLEKGGANIEIAEAGNYTISLNLDPAGYSYSLVKN